jgi:Mannosylglycerate hydrolase MGH1-like glycoside hydrolase domain
MPCRRSLVGPISNPLGPLEQIGSAPYTGEVSIKAVFTVPLVLVLGGLLFTGCPRTSTEEILVEEPDLGPRLNLDLDAPVLLTFAAAPDRTRYLEDEGYTLARDDDGVVRMVTDTAGDLGFAFHLEDRWYVGEADFSSPVLIHHTTSDGVLYDFDLIPGLRVEVRFVVATSRVAAVELVVRSTLSRDVTLTVLPWMRRCGDGRYPDPAGIPDGLRASHNTGVDLMLEVVGPGTYLTELTDALVAPGLGATWTSLEGCSDTVAEDVAALAAATGPPGYRVAMLGLPFALYVPTMTNVPARLYRAVVDSARQPLLGEELAEAQRLSPVALLTASHQRLQAIPTLEGLTGGAATVFRSSFVLLDQLMMPAEGVLDHDYYLLSREPTWWFARLGQHMPESLAMILMAHFDPAAALASHRVFLDRVSPDGYLPYNIGPVVEQTALGTASAPLFSYIAWEIAQITGDATFLADAYEAGTRIHGFWVDQRDVDGDGLAEWGGYGATESMRDQENVIWDTVAAPEEVEGVALNTLLVKDASTLALMADALGLTADASDWRGRARSRAALINDTMWDEETGFYYHVDRDTNTFDHTTPADLKRMEIAGLLPLWGGFVPADRLDILLDHLSDPASFWREGGVPGLAANDPYYSPEADRCCRWRGPMMVHWQWLLMRGLVSAGADDLAVELTRRVLEAVRIPLSDVHQFRELYNPDDLHAPNHSLPNYLWSTLVALMMMETDHLKQGAW